MSLFKKIILIAANSLCAALIIAAAIIAVYFSGLLRSQQVAADWRGESGERFSQVSVFIPDISSVSENTIKSFRTTVDAKLVDASLEAPESGSLWTDAYCARGELTVEGSRGSATTAALGVGGDFFIFHPYYLLSGSYIYQDDLMKDRVVLDEELAWRLFGGTDLAGMEVTISGKPYLIAGVVRREDDFASKKAGGEGTMIFLSYEAYMDINGAASSGPASDDDPETASGAATGITCYEAVLPDPISGFARSLMEESFPQAGIEAVENTGRFGFERMFSVIGDFGERSMRVNGIIYPYWENAARYLEDWLALIQVLALAIALCPLITLIWLLVRLKRYLGSRKKDIKAAVERQTDKITRARYEKRQQKEHEKRLEELPEIVDDFDIDAIVSEILKESGKDGE